MRSSQRLVVVCLALALIVALVRAPVASSLVLADDNVRIDVPASGTSISGSVEIRGRATTADPSRFSFYRLHYGSGSSPNTLRPIGGAGERAVENGMLGVWDTAPLITGEYTLLLTVYDVSGATTVARVVVHVLPAPTPTLRTDQWPLVVVPPGATPTDSENTGPTPTPIPELPQLDPQIPQIDLPPQDSGAPPVQPVNSQPSDPGFQPIPITGPNPVAPSSLPPAGPGPAPAPQPNVLSPIDTGPASAPPPAINPVAPPPPPIVAPYEPPPALPTIAPPTPDGIPL